MLPDEIKKYREMANSYFSSPDTHAQMASAILSLCKAYEEAREDLAQCRADAEWGHPGSLGNGYH